jgi:hypothetical protein
MIEPRISKADLERLLEYALSKQQIDLIKRRIDGQTMRQIAAETGVTERVHQRALERVQRRAAAAGWSPAHDMTHTVPDGFTVRGVSTLYNQDGQVTAQWVKSQSEQQRHVQILTDKLDSGDTGFKPFKPTKEPAKTDDNLLSLLTITDFHMGMYAWDAESGENWDVTIARQVFLDSLSAMIKAAPCSGVGILNQLGDFLHYDGLLAITTNSGHVLDSDTRYGKLVDLTMDVMAEAVRMMLRRFAKVHVIQAEGNHDESGSIWLRKHIKHMFKHEPRVTVDDTEFPYYAYLHGQTMLGFHHGHKVKLGQLHKLFASEPRYRSMWGQASHTYIHTGHYHHEKVIEDGGAIAEQHPTLAARDAYATRGGWQSRRGAKIITYDKVDGEVHRVTVRPKNG